MTYSSALLILCFSANNSFQSQRCLPSFLSTMFPNYLAYPLMQCFYFDKHAATICTRRTSTCQQLYKNRLRTKLTCTKQTIQRSQRAPTLTDGVISSSYALIKHVEQRKVECDRVISYYCLFGFNAYCLFLFIQIYFSSILKQFLLM